MMYTTTAKAPMEQTHLLAATDATRVVPQHWCAQCRKQTWVIAFEEAFEIWAAGSQGASQTGSQFQSTELHQVKLASGEEMICLPSLFPNAF